MYTNNTESNSSFTQYTIETVPRRLVTVTASYHNYPLSTKNETHHRHDLDASDYDRECLSSGASEVSPVVAHDEAVFLTSDDSD